MNPDLAKLQLYPFQRFAKLTEGLTPPTHLDHIALSVGEPKHPTPAFIAEALATHLHSLANYPSTRGSGELREAISKWLTRRFNLCVDGVDPNRQVLPVNGTREALFALAQCVVNRAEHPLVLMPNPFYQIYEGAALLAGAQPYYLNCEASNRYLPDIDRVPPDVWDRCQLVYLCTPGNPTGTLLDEATLQSLINLAEQYDFIIASDECYSEIYLDEQNPPGGLLEAATRMGNDTYKRCVVLHSLSKRSNSPGLRSGFVAGDAEILKQFLQYRTYHGCTMPPPTQAASIAAWKDEAHVVENRRLYREKFDAVLKILSPSMAGQRPEGGFYLWPLTPIDDEDFARRLFAEQHVSVLPGSYLSREVRQRCPGYRHVRLALVPPLDECVDAAQRVRTVISNL